QIETGSFFFDVRWREVHRRASSRPIVPAIGNRGGDAVFAFLDRGVGQANDDDRRQSARRVDLDLDFVGINAENRGGINFREHLREVGREIFARKGTNPFSLKLRAKRGLSGLPGRPAACLSSRAHARDLSQDGGSHEVVWCPIARSRGPSTLDRKSTRLNSSHVSISYAVFCLK